MRRGGFEPNLERVRGLLGARRDAMLEALERELGTSAGWSRPQGGYFLWLDLAEGTDTKALLAESKGEGVSFVGSVVLNRIKRNPAPLFGLLGAVFLLVLLRRRR